MRSQARTNTRRLWSVISALSVVMAGCSAPGATDESGGDVQGRAEASDGAAVAGSEAPVGGQRATPTSESPFPEAPATETATASGVRLQLLDTHDPAGAWMAHDRWNIEAWLDTGKASLDDQGVPITNYRWGSHYSPTTVAHWGLVHYSRFARSGASDMLDIAEAMGGWLTENQAPDGCFPWEFEHRFRGGELREGWCSGLSQGLAMALLARLHHATGEERYRASALAALEPLAVPVAEGGLLRVYDEEYWFYEEYPTPEFPNYVLNGFQSTVIGLHDVAELLESDRARELFERGVATLDRMIGLYDLGDRTAYDLVHHTVPGELPNPARWGYHATHVRLLSVLDVLVDTDEVITGGYDPVIERWAGYLDGEFIPSN